MHHCTKKNKIPRNKPTQGDKRLVLQNYKYKTQMKKIKDNINRQKDTPCYWIRRINIVKMTMLPKANYSFNTTATKLPMAFPQNLNKKKILKFI